MNKYLLTLLTALIPLIFSCKMMKTKADLILINGRIYTVDPSMHIAQAMAVGRGKVLASGRLTDILGKYTASQIIDLKGRPVYPGFIDAHSHFYGYALNLRYIDLNAADSFEEVIRRLKNKTSASSGTWIIGRGWDQNLWKVKKFPDRKILDQLFPENPVVLIRIDGHVVLANAVALKIAGIETAGKYLKGEVETDRGRLTGILCETAADHIRNIIPQPEKEINELISRAQYNCFSVGLTAVCDAGIDQQTVSLYQELSKNSSLKIRVYAMLTPSGENIRNFIKTGPLESDRLVIRSFKLYADGSLGSRTALLKKEYSDMHGNLGIQVTSSDTLRKICRLCLENGFQVNTHAIGDSAVKLVLKIYSEYLKNKNDNRWRIEHCQVVDPQDIPLFGEYSVIPSVQATHATSDMNWAGDRLGPERIRNAYAYKSLLEQNKWLANGTDFPIEHISPVYTFYASVARKDLMGKPEGGFQPENALSREEALRSVTIWAARAGFWEQEIGSLEPGKKADFVILDRDIMEVSFSEIPGARVLATYIEGIRMFDAMSH